MNEEETITLELDTEVYEKLVKIAKAQGVTVEEYASRAVHDFATKYFIKDESKPK